MFHETFLGKAGFGLVFLILAVTSVGFFVTYFGAFSYSSVLGAGSSVGVSSTLAISNAAPLVSSVFLNGNSEIILTPYATTAVSVSAVLTDYNGCDGILNGTATIMIFRSAITSSTCATSPNNLNCYLATAFTATSSCQNDISIYATTTFGVYYFADATDTSSSYESQNWIANAVVTDSSGTVATGESFDSPGVELRSLTAIAVGTSSINYGTLSPLADTGGVNEILPIINAGNSSATLDVYGTALTLASNSITTSSQHYATSAFYFGGSEQSLSDVQTTITGLTFLPRVSFVNDIGSWVDTTALPNTVKIEAYANTADFLYVTGGQTTSTVRFTDFNSDGTLNSWTDTTALPSARLQHAAAIFSNYIYVVGGSNIPSVVYAPLNATGSVGAWTNNSGPTGFEMYNLPAVAYRGYLYVFGGVGAGDAEVNDVYFTPFSSDGSLGTWVAATDLPSVLSNSAAVAYNDYVYVIGGESGGVETSTVMFASISFDGSLGSWTNTTVLPAARTTHAAVVEDGYIYVLGGGRVIGGATSSVFYAPINATGSVGAWTALTSLPTTHSIFASIVNKGYIYGLPNGGSTSTVVYSSISNAQTQQDTFWGLELSQFVPPGAYSGVNTFVASYVP